jgi:hypothetical protein
MHIKESKLGVRMHANSIEGKFSALQFIFRNFGSRNLRKINNKTKQRNNNCIYKGDKLIVYQL